MMELLAVAIMIGLSALMLALALIAPLIVIAAYRDLIQRKRK